MLIAVGFGFAGKAQRWQTDQPDAGRSLFLLLNTGHDIALNELAGGLWSLIEIATRQQRPAHRLTEQLRRIRQAGGAQQILEQQVGRVAALERFAGRQLDQQQAITGAVQLQGETRHRQFHRSGLSRLLHLTDWRHRRFCPRRLDLHSRLTGRRRGRLSHPRSGRDCRHRLRNGNRLGRQRLRELGLVGISDAPHATEHSLEVQLPFLQAVLGEFDLLPIATGHVPRGLVARALEAAWNGPETLIVVSSDLSHHHTSAEAQKLDDETTRSILERRGDLTDEQACGARGINGLIQIAQRRGLAVALLDQRNSGDTAGDRSRVVGYGSYAVYEA